MKAKELTELGQWKVGQKVNLTNRYGTDRIITIQRITDGRGGTLYTEKMSFDKDGRERGVTDSWAFTRIKPAEEADYIRILGNNAKMRLSKIKWDDLEPAKALMIEKILHDNGIVT